MDANSLQLFLYLAGVALGVIFIVLWLSGQSTTKGADTDLIANAKREQQENPEKNLPHYNELYGRLLLYIDSTLQQNARYYRLIVVIFCTGFLMTVHGSVSGQPPEQAWLPILAGIMTELVAVTVLLIYRPVFQQTESYFKILEHLTRIGMSIRVLDDLANDVGAEAIKSTAKADIAKLLLEFHAQAVVEGKRKADQPAS